MLSFGPRALEYGIDALGIFDLVQAACASSKHWMKFAIKASPSVPIRNSVVASLYAAHSSGAMVTFKAVYNGSRSMRWGIAWLLDILTVPGAVMPSVFEDNVGVEKLAGRLRAAGSMSGIVRMEVVDAYDDRIQRPRRVKDQLRASRRRRNRTQRGAARGL